MDIPEGGRVHATKAPRKAVAAPKYGPSTKPNIVATRASRLMVMPPMLMGILGDISERM